MNSTIQVVIELVIVILLAIPLARYILSVMQGKTTFLSPVEKGIYKLFSIDPNKQMSALQYFEAVAAISLVGFVFLWVLLMIQGWLPLNPQNAQNMSWSLALNTAISFVTNTNWQAYASESDVSTLVQCIGLMVQNFLSAGIGMSVVFALMRGFVKNSSGIGNFFADLTRSILYVLLPLSLLLSVGLMAGGVVENLNGSGSVEMLEPVAVDGEGNVIDDAVMNEQGQVVVNGQVDPDASWITEEYVPGGLAASQVAIKQLGSNGGGFFTANSAHPFENPNAWTNFVEIGSILLIPVSLVFCFGQMVGRSKQGRVIFIIMLIGLVLALIGVFLAEQFSTTALSGSSLIASSGNMEGKESRFGISLSSAWTAITTSTSSGSVNSALSDYSPAAQMICLLLMEMGSVFFGGIGCGLYTMIGFILLTVFISGLMVGRTPEFLGKKIDPKDMRWAVVITMTSAFFILLLSSAAALIPGVFTGSTDGAYGFTQLLYAFSSAGTNNGSAMSGFVNSTGLNLLLSIAMLFGRMIPILGVLMIASSMAQKKTMAVSAGTLATDNGLFVFLVLLIVVLVGALAFLPALALGPLALMMG